MATGVVSGAAALLLQRAPSLTPGQVKALLVRTTQPYGWESGQALPDPIADGSGLLDAYRAVRAAPRGRLQDGLLCGALLPMVTLCCVKYARSPGGRAA